MATKPRTAPPNQLRADTLQAQIGATFDDVLTSRGADPRHWAAFQRAWAKLGYDSDPAMRSMKADLFADLAPYFARRDLRAALAVDTANPRHWAAFERSWARLGYGNDPAKQSMKADLFADLVPYFARRDLREMLASHAAQEQARQRATDRALVTRLDAAIETTRGRRRRPLWAM